MSKFLNQFGVRLPEYKVFLYRMFLVFVFFQIARLFFYLYNADLVKINSVSTYIKLAFYGTAFDTTAIFYSNSLFTLLSLLPLLINTQKGFQRALTVLYFITNGIAFGANFIDFIYYPYIQGRTTISVWESLQHEQNKSNLFSQFVLSYWHVYLLFIVLMALWIFLYGRYKVKCSKPKVTISYFLTSLVMLLVVATLMVGGIRGDFKKSTRPINMLDASRKISNPTQSALVLNTPFAFMRTMDENSFQKQYFLSETEADSIVKPIKQYSTNETFEKPNIVIFILESFGKEYVGFCNKNTTIPNYKSYTPFLDSLAQHSYIFTNAYANGYKSIHGMSSVLAGIPSFEHAFTSSPFVYQPIGSLVSVLKSEGYKTSFYHGAPNGSMGFLGFSNILGIEEYYGMTEFNDNTQFDGFWGIWDEPFLQYVNRTLHVEKQPFMATVFTVSSHEPYIIPQQYEGKFPQGDIKIHPTIGYTDYALRQFFASAQKEEWFSHTLFVFVADHSNLTYYDDYQKVMNWNTVPIMFYYPQKKWVGKSQDIAQQIDIFPSILHQIGYQKPFRSWGRSLFDKTSKPFAIRFANGQYQYIHTDFVLLFDGTKAVGLYHTNDKALTQNVMQHFPQETLLLEKECKAYIQTYMNSIVERKLN